MTLHQYLEKKKEMQEKLISFIDEESEEKNSFDELIKYFKNTSLIQNRDEFKNTLYLLLKVANNHQRTPNFFEKIEQILLSIKDEIKQTLSNFEIFHIFKSNKRILLFLIKTEIIIPDSSFVATFSNPRYRYTQFKFQNFLLPEIENLLDKKTSKKIKGEISRMLNLRVKNLTESEEFEKRRKIGENDNFICQLIRNDSIEEFIIHVNKNNLSLKSKIKPSIFETNTFLLKNEPTLIEYAAFFGSVQIFQYLRLNGAQIKPSIWLFAIHGRNPELINILEESKIDPPNNSYQECLNESLKCHHFEITDYIMVNLLTFENQEEKEKIFMMSTKYVNYRYFPNNLTYSKTFYYLCKYDYIEIVKLLMNNEDVKIEFKNIFNQKFFLFNLKIFIFKSNFKI